MPIGELFLSAFLQVLFDRLASREVIEFATLWNVKSKLKKLKTTLSAIQAVLNDAEEKQIRDDAVRVWLDDLQNLAYDAEDLLDEFATETLRRNIKANSQTHTNQVWSFVTPSISHTAIKTNIAIGSKIKKITKKLEKIVKKKQDLGLIEGVGQSSIEVRERTQTTALVNESHVYGREEDVKKIIELLLSDEPSDNVVSVITIVGMGGAGKTTLAQAVYNHESLKNHFDVTAWACVSDEFDVKRVTLAILESATKNSCDVVNLDPLQARLMEVLNGKKFLIVLDDVWSNKYNEWDVLQKPFRAGAKGSKIIVTTRSRDVALMMCSVPPHDLGVLSNEDCWSLFSEHAFGNRDPSAHPNLEAIGKKIVERCGGLPLAAKTLGGLLRSEVRIDEWEDVLNSEIWRNNEVDILPALRISYHHLPAHLKRCFAYCAIFPYDYEFKEEDLVLYWMAEGFVQPKENKRLEDIGGEYFRDLLQRSFFQKGSTDESKFSMHDLINDLAQSVSRGICFRMADRLEGNMKDKIPEIARHSSYLRGEYDRITVFQPFYKVKCLRTFLPLDRLYRSPYNYLPNRVPNDLFLKLRCLRVLCLSGYKISELADSIGNLKQLRYLDLSDTDIERLPESTSTLYNLQTLKLIFCNYLTELPKDLRNLINLCHLDTSQCYMLKKFPLGIGRMTSLQSLSDFVVGDYSGPSIRELGEMVHLRGSLCISKLKNVVNSGDAIYAKLNNKQHLHTLDLNWGFYLKDNMDDSRDERVEYEVLDKLLPHTNLQRLAIRNYGGTRFPSWIWDPSYSTIVDLNLTFCKKCESLPPLGQLPSLKCLRIRRLDEVKIIGREFYGNGSVEPFPLLETLEFFNMKKLEEWSGVEEGKEFPRLRQIEINKCLKLRRFSIRSPSLKELAIQCCDELNGVGLQHFASLRRLTIFNCSQLVTLSNEDTGLPAKLEYLEIENCENLEKLPANLTFLQELKIGECSALGSFPETGLPSMLRRLDITKCENLKSLPEGMIHNNTFLKHLNIKNCDSLTSFPRGGLPTSLEYLGIHNCSSLVSLPEGMQNNMFLKDLVIWDCKNLESLPEGIHNLTSLTSLNIKSCPLLTSFPEGGLPTTVKVTNLTSLQELRIKSCPSLVSFPEEGLPNNIKTLEIETCENLKALPHRMHNLTSLQFLIIESCPSLVSFPEEGLPNNIETLFILACLNLKALPHRMHNLTSLQYLRIKSCPSLVSFPEEGLPNNIKTLFIVTCENLKALPHRMHNLTSLQDLIIQSCPSLVSFPAEGLPNNIEILCILTCLNLKALPHRMHNLTSLQNLRIESCPSLVSFPEEGLPNNIKTLYIETCLNLKALPHRMHNLTSLQDLSIHSCPSVSFPEGGLPANLIELKIKDCENLEQPLSEWGMQRLTTLARFHIEKGYLKSLPKGLHSLTSLKELRIYNCHKLASFPKEGLPTMLCKLYIEDCPMLKQRCQKGKGADWHKIAHIPCIRIDDPLMF